MYRTTYYGHHTCKNLLKASQLFLDSATDQCPMISFGTHITEKDLNPLFTSFQSIKREAREDHQHNQGTSDITYKSQSPSSDYLLSSDQMTAFESTGHMTVLSSDDVISGVNSSSCTANAHSLDMGAGIVESVDFDDVLQFDF